MMKEVSQGFAIAVMIVAFTVAVTAGIVTYPIIGKILLLALFAGFAVNAIIWACIWLRKAFA